MSSLLNGFCYREYDTCEHCAHAEFHGDEAGQTYVSCTLNDDFMVDRYQHRGCRDFKDVDCIKLPFIIATDEEIEDGSLYKR